MGTLALLLLSASVFPQQDADAQKRYESFVTSLDVDGFRKDHPELAGPLEDGEPQERAQALRKVMESGDVRAIPLVIPLLDFEYTAPTDGRASLRIPAGLCLWKMVERNELKRRDPTRPDKVVILPRKEGDLDLRPMAHVILKMLVYPDDGNTQAYAASMIGLLGLSEMRGKVEGLLKSRHPAVQNAAKAAIEMLAGE